VRHDHDEDHGEGQPEEHDGRRPSRHARRGALFRRLLREGGWLGRSGRRGRGPRFCRASQCLVARDLPLQHPQRPLAVAVEIRLPHRLDAQARLGMHHPDPGIAQRFLADRRRIKLRLLLLVHLLGQHIGRETQ